MNELTDKVWNGIEARLVDIKRALADQTEETQRYVLAVSKSRIKSLGWRFPNFTPENLFKQILDEDKAEISEYVFDGPMVSYKIEFRDVSCRFPRPRIEADYTTRGGILIWKEKSSFPMSTERARGNLN